MQIPRVVPTPIYGDLPVRNETSICAMLRQWVESGPMNLQPVAELLKWKHVMKRKRVKVFIQPPLVRLGSRQARNNLDSGFSVDVPTEYTTALNDVQPRRTKKAPTTGRSLIQDYKLPYFTFISSPVSAGFITRFSNSSRKRLIMLCTGHAAASPSAQMVLPSMLFATSRRRSMSSIRAS